ncbi:MAG: GPGG-motif small membrane protein [Candidatus Nanopelagicales bacterium]
MDFLLWLIAVALVVGGIVAIVRKEVVMGVLLIVLGLLVGPGGVSLLS